jgi:hypothetical protein
MSLPGFTAEAATEDGSKTDPEGVAQAKYRISVPGLRSGEAGLGDIVTRTAAMVGATPCGGCYRRAQILNSWVSFTPRR